jgi:ribosome-associated translation inhibitor RaiA
MDLQITYRNVSESAHRTLSGEFHKLARKHLERLVEHFPPDLVRLRVVVEHSKHHSNLHRVRLVLTVPGGQFTSEKTADSYEAAAKGGSSALETRVIEYLERLRGEDEWKRVKRREQLRGGFRTPARTSAELQASDMAPPFDASAPGEI